MSVEEKERIICEEDEIDLIELWQTLKKHKLAIFITTIIAIIAAVIFIITTKPKYEAVATLQIGGQLVQTSNGLATKYFENVNKIKEYLDIKYDVNGKYRKKGTKSYIENVSVPKRTKGFITITAYGPNNNEAIKTLKVALDDVISKHKAFYDNIIRQNEIKIEELKKQILHDNSVSLPLLKRDIYILQNINLKKIDEKVKLAKDIEIPAIQRKIAIANSQLNAKLENLKQLSASFKNTKSKNPTLAAIISLRIDAVQNDIKNLKQQIIDYKLQIKKILEETIPDLEKQKTQILKKQIPMKEAAIKQLLNVTIPHLKDQIEHLKLTMQPPYLVMTKIVGKIYTHNYPVKPKKKLILIVALITGLILGIFLAFFIEFIQRAKESGV